MQQTCQGIYWSPLQAQHYELIIHIIQCGKEARLQALIKSKHLALSKSLAWPQEYKNASGIIYLHLYSVIKTEFLLHQP